MQICAMGETNKSVFLKGSAISQASSVQKALNRLIALKIIFHYEDEHRFVNPFFRAWILKIVAIL